MKRAIIFPLCVGLTTMIILFLIKISNIEICKVDFVLNAIITCVVTLAGFILTSISIIIGMSGSPIMEKISKDGGLPELVARYSTTMILSLLLIVTFISLGATIGKDNVINRNGIIIGAGILTAYFISLVYTCYYLLRIISKIPDKSSVETVLEPSSPQGDFR